MFRLTVIVLLLLPSLLPAQDQLGIGGVDASAYPELRLSLRLSLGGRVVYPIDASRLVVREDGRLLYAGLDCPAPVAGRPSLAIGFERSLDANFPKAQTAARAFLERMRFTDDGAEASLWSFATSVDQETAMTRDSTWLRRALDALSVAAWPFNGTALYETMHRAIEDVNAAGSGTRKAVVFFTDGTNNSSLYGRSRDDVSGRAAIDGIRIYVVLVKNRDEGEAAMRMLAAETGGFMVYESDPEAADSVYRALVEPDAARLWCTAVVSSPMCANGALRRVETGYVRAPGDTLWSTATYQSPWRADDASGCLRIEPVTRPAMVRVSLDTVLAERGGEARLQLRIDASDIPEGAQLLTGAITVDTTLTRFDAAAPIDPASLPVGWTLRRGALRLAGSEEVLEWEVGGPAIDGAFVAGALRLRASHDPAYLRPVFPRIVTANMHAVSADGAGANGLIVIRDSCRNNLVALTGITPAPPWPQPATQTVRLRLDVASAQAVAISVVDALGRSVARLPRQELAEGISEFQLDVSALQSGRYSIQYDTASGTFLQPLIIVR